MCVTFEPAELSDTTLYIGECIHPSHGLIHVVGYQNHVKNTSPGANCMLLHFPCATPMKPENALDCFATPTILEDMRQALQSSTLDNLFEMPEDWSDEVHVFDVGSYTVVMSSSPNQIPQALELVPENRRPALNIEIFDWYQENFKGFSVALCCFESQIDQASEPLLWWYKPLRTDILTAPAIDSHDGHAPKPGVDVDVNHHLIVSLPEWCQELEVQEPGALRELSIIDLTEDGEDLADRDSEGSKVYYSDQISDLLRPLLPSHVVGHEFSGQMANGDFHIARQGLTPETLFENTYRFADTKINAHVD